MNGLGSSAGPAATSITLGGAIPPQRAAACRGNFSQSKNTRTQSSGTLNEG